MELIIEAQSWFEKKIGDREDRKFMKGLGHVKRMNKDFVQVDSGG